MLSCSLVVGCQSVFFFSTFFFFFFLLLFFFFQAEDGIRDLVRSRGLGDVYKRQADALRRLRRVGVLRPAGADAARLAGRRGAG